LPPRTWNSLRQKPSSLKFGRLYNEITIAPVKDAWCPYSIHPSVPFCHYESSYGRNDLNDPSLCGLCDSARELSIDLLSRTAQSRGARREKGKQKLKLLRGRRFSLSLSRRHNMQCSQEREPSHHKPISLPTTKVELARSPDKPKASNCSRGDCTRKRSQPARREKIEHACHNDGIAGAVIHDVKDAAQIGALHVVPVKPQAKLRYWRTFFGNRLQKAKTLRKGEVQ